MGSVYSSTSHGGAAAAIGDVSAEGRRPGDQLGGELDLLVLVVGVVDLVEEQLGSGTPQRLPRLANRREGYGRAGSEGDVVVADDREVLGDPLAGGDDLLQQSERDEVVGAEDRARAAPSRQARDPLAGDPALLDG